MPIPTLDDIVQRIYDLQSKGDKYFDEGLFATYRTNTRIGYQRPDTTVFFTAIIAFTLQKIKPLSSPKSQQLIAKIVDKALENYPNFQNKDGLKTYNFWKTHPSRHFPNGYLFRHFDHFRIPDDVDDTAMIYLTSSPSQDELVWLKNKLTLHANHSQRIIQNTYPEYQSLRAYSTWFGKNMYIEFDACVLSNLLYCIYHYQLPLNQHDADSLTYIRAVVASGQYLAEPFRCAHQYPRTSLIIYHIARLLGTFHIPELSSIYDKLVADARHLLTLTEHPLDQIILHTSLLRLGGKTATLGIPSPNLNLSSQDFKGFYFFIAGLLTAYEYPLLYQLARSPWFHIRWQCEAHCWSLVAENLALQESF